ncbi:helix-turn-helix transcriptional regulator [Weissella paramesenteroides]|jgi:transcriptional regulator with XRE-family HTH domain|uniref:helix-turn-helix domain-containing protein n=1 Tax=Weissella paramesenteroides TaxID=1249 RepID=UPI001040A187|nr:helix-turn-helix transcriptional regulator [Weissella paramesenteroides]KAA8439123.1 helix-turn-helix transcriptional regulator [Weissella paramesenteroides]KAA8440169.1 helix-turn-helix transcriptional regulator [Weissella paramesenteroides]KAA8443920.1 helix-turn-helix transcriptional regulator [Weissella paramesenteroides]KAA8446401.1 helix-turn-helix transcriptional regulator [Weissella paramesenteroides]KAA8451471.1 helix-turn-helix transcriptional regulator [Weissella paramesenteroide
MTLFERVKKISKQKGYSSLKSLAEDAGLGVNAVYQWKSQTPRTDNLQAVADVLGVSVDYLLGNTDDMHANKKDESTVDLIAAHWGIDLDNLSQEEKAIVMARARDYVKGLVDAFESK